MTIGWKNESTRAPGRSTFGDNVPVTSKATRRYGAQGSKTDFPHSSTGENPAKLLGPDDIAPSIAPRHVGHIGPPRAEVVGHAPDGSGKWLSPTHDRELIGNAIETHPRLEPQGLANSASGGRHGKVSKPPAGKNEGYRHRMDHGALAGESGGRDSYTGGRGKIRP